MANKSLVNWLLDFCDQIEGVEEVVAPDQYAQGLHDGSRITQNGIAKKLRYAAEQEKKRPTKRVPDVVRCAACQSTNAFEAVICVDCCAHTAPRR